MKEVIFMSNIAVICEYNPFHFGHAEQIATIKKEFGSDSTLISLMSGNTVQRGELAVYPKYKRAEAAVLCGIDLILELPCIYSCASAEAFARGAVKLLNKLGNIDILCFGSENGNIDELTQISENLSSDKFISSLRDSEKCDSHARTGGEIYEKMFGSGFPNTPNDILAVEYLTALKLTNSKIKPYTYKRKSGYSATDARNAIYSNTDISCHIPPKAAAVFLSEKPTDKAGYGFIAMNTLSSSESEEMSAFSGMNGGVSGALLNRLRDADNFDGLIANTTCRTYTSSRLKRAVLASLLGITDNDRKSEPLVTSLLGASEKGCGFLSHIRKTSEIDIVTKAADHQALSNDAKRQFEFTVSADRLFHIVRSEPSNNAVTNSPFIMKQIHP